MHDFMYTDYSGIAVLHITFFLIVMTILINVIFGIIIDTFGSLRGEKDARELVTRNYCFVCGIEYQIFDRSSNDGTGFRHHIKFDHCMWNYLKYIIFLWEQDQDDDDGLEQYVRHCVEGLDVSWFPMGKAIRLNQTESEEERLYRESKAVINNTQLHLQTKIDLFQVDLYGSLSQMAETLMLAAVPANSSLGVDSKSNVLNLSNAEDDEGEELLGSVASLSASQVESVVLSEGY